VEPFDDPERQLARRLGSEMRRLRERKHLTQGALARKAGHYSRSTIATVETGWGKCSLKLIEGCDEALGAGGALVQSYIQLKEARVRCRRAAREEENSVPTRRETFRYLGAGLLAMGMEQVGATMQGRIPRVLHALELTRQPTVPSPDPAVMESLTGLVGQYMRSARTLPPQDLYGEIVGVRAYAGALLEGLPAANANTDLIALVTHDLGDQAASLVWCTDAERRSRDAGMPELAGWASNTRVCMAFYNGRGSEAVGQARRGQSLTPLGTVAHAQLGVQEMRACALLGDADATFAARRRAERAIAKLPVDAPTQGAFSISLADDPPLTATSLLLLGRFREAEDATRRLIATRYGPGAHDGRGEHPSGFARCHLVLGLALAGLGKLEEAHAAGVAALYTPRLVWPTVVLAGKLDQSLMHDFGDTHLARDFHERYVTAVQQTQPRPVVANGGPVRRDQA
jgi:DNA-binding XRE family transcriptional regulator